ncbi:MAG: hypothetical protein GEU75_00580 [Dehalococcoidia bacterium]|nr:hypothetical protein [Dehalococcoidia bacterium]
MANRLFEFSPRVRALVGVTARLVLFVIAFQMVAIDHWHAGDADIIGVENSQTHVLHCHGGTAGCADVSGLAAALDNVSLTPPSPLSFRFEAESPLLAPQAAFVSAADQPPRQA